MTRIVFYEWLKNFKEYVKIEPGRGVALLIDNASGHDEIDILPIFGNVVVLFLHINSASQLQPLDSGSIATVKARYKKFLVEKAVDRMESGICTNLYGTDLLVTSWKIYKIWGSMESEYWLKTRIRGHSRPESNSQSIYFNARKFQVTCTVKASNFRSCLRAQRATECHTRGSIIIMSPASNFSVRSTPRM